MSFLRTWDIIGLYFDKDKKWAVENDSNAFQDRAEFR
jgi:hypothetical protein